MILISIFSSQVFATAEAPQTASTQPNAIAISPLSEPDKPNGFRIVTKTTASPSWNNVLRWPSVTRVGKDDRLQVSFWLRSAEPTPVDKRIKIALVDRKNSASRILETTVYNPTTTWKKVEIGLKSWDFFKPGDLLLEFWLGLDQQAFSIANVQVEDQGPTFPEYQLRNTVRYPGSSPNAPWRKLAEDRIAANRMGTLTVQVVDGSGKPTKATVRATMVRNAFDFGTALTAGMIGDNLQPSSDYQASFLANFNAAVFENDTKWAQYIGNGWKEWDGKNNPNLLGAVKFLRSQGIPVRGHCLVWPTLGKLPAGYYYMPPDLTKATDPDTIKSRVKSHIETALASVPFDEWDVLNEAYDNTDLQGTLAGGNRRVKPGLLASSEIAGWFKLVNTLAPKVRTYYNNFSTIEGNDVNRVAYDKALIQYVRANGGRIDGVGLQSHFTAGNAQDPALLNTRLDDWAAQNVRLKVTEFDMAADDPDGVASFLKDYLTTCYSNANVDGFYVWGFWAGQMYQSRSALFGKDWKPTPAGEAWQALRKAWTTDAIATTDDKGVSSVKGYTGKYLITVRRGSKTNTATADLTTKGTKVVVTVK